MSTFSLLARASVLSGVLALLGTAASAQGVYASTAVHASARPDLPRPAADVAPLDQVVLLGKITNAAGPLPGAVVILTATKQMAATNAAGEFQFVVPASAGALQAVVTYAGYADEAMTLNAAADESTVSLTNARIIVVARRQQLKFYLKTARKQAKRSLKQVRR